MEYIGKKFGDYVCIDVRSHKTHGKVLILKCEICGAIIAREARKIKPSKHSYRNCGDKYYLSFVGKQIGDFTIIKFLYKENFNANFALKCNKCGEIINIWLATILRRKKLYHGDLCISGVPETIYRKKIILAYENMRNRHKHKGTEYKFVVDFYHDFIDEFREHIEKYGERNTAFEIIDKSKGITKENIRVSTVLKKTGNV